MAIRLSDAQKAFIKDRGRVEDLAVWILGADNHVTRTVRADARMRATSAPDAGQIDSMCDYVRTRATEGTLVRLINGFAQRTRA